MRENITLKYPDTPAFYKLTLKSGHYYVGSTKRLSKRLRDHRHYLETGTHHNEKFLSHFTEWSEVTVEFNEYQFLELARAHEQAHLDEYYLVPELCNVATNVDSLWGGQHGMPQEVRDKIAAGHRGKTHGQAFRDKCRERMLGSVMSDEHKLKISETLKGREVSVEHRANLSRALKGKGIGRKASPSAIENMRKAQQGKTMPEEAKRKIAEANYKRVSVYDVEYESLQACAVVYDVSHSTVTNRAKSDKPKWHGWRLL
jgi:group I intron endonuclease